MGDERVTRRRYLGALGTVAAAGLAGCSGVFQGSTTESGTTTGATHTAGAEQAAEATGTAATTQATEAKPMAVGRTADANATGSEQAATGVGTQNTTAGENASADESPYTEVYRAAIDSVVLIRVTTARGGDVGTGFVYDDSHIVTNAHVVRNPDSIRIRFSNEAYYDASVVGTDVSSDLAALETTIPDGISPLSVQTDQPAIGTEVLAIGNPFGKQYSGSASAGIVSNVNRSIQAQNGYTIPDAIQTDAAINPGNSGGPLMNLDGEVLGVTNSGRVNSQNISFAISGALIHRVIPALIENGEYHHAYMGVKLATVTPTIAKANNLDTPRGVIVASTQPNGPSDGVLKGGHFEQVDRQQVPVGGDVIRSMDGTEIDTRQQLSSYLALQASPGETIPVTVLRDGAKKTVHLKLGSRPNRVGIAGSTTTR